MQREREEEEEQNESVDSLMCPSFSTYSSNNLSLLADQISPTHHSASLNDDNDNFEFFAFSNQQPSHRIGAVFPIFNRDYVTESDNIGGGSHGGGRNSGEDVDSPALQFSLKQLLISDEDICRESSSSSSSSEVDELDGIPAGTYCVWTPKSVQSVQGSPNKCKKSNSTGSSSESPAKRWKLLDLLRRSKSDGKRTLVWLKQKKKEEVKSEIWKVQKRDSRNYDDIAGKKVSRERENQLPVTVAAPAHEVVYGRSRESNKRRTYFPYNGEGYLIGMGRAFSPF